MMELSDLKVTFCIVCMNRLHQLKETLMQNIVDNADYKNLKFLILNYNSGDELNEWAKENLSTYIKNGRLVFYHTKEPLIFNHSHSKNVAFKLAQGEIVCNINADHFTGKGFARYIATKFNDNRNIVLSPIDFPKKNLTYDPPKDVFGRVCVKKKDFLQITGYDEHMTGYGFEDWDFVNRLELIGIRRTLIDLDPYLNFIPHKGGRRTFETEIIKFLYIRHINPSTSEILFFYNNGSFERVIAVDNITNGSENWRYALTPREYRFEYSMKTPKSSSGTWIESLTNIKLFHDQNHMETLIKDLNNTCAVLKNKKNNFTYHRVLENDLLENILAFKEEIENRNKMEANLKEKKIQVNFPDYGNATVFKNFNYSFPIYI